MHDVLAEHVRGGRVPGLVSVLSRRGETQVDVVGSMAADGRDPMSRDALFRIASLTKPITAVATMILIEECAVRLDDPVQQWLPELADRQVLTRLDGPLTDTVPATRPITVRDLLTFRLGWGQIMDRPEDYPILTAIRERDLLGFGPPGVDYPLDPDQWLARLAELPLMHQPGEKWMYNTGSYVLGVLIARVSGQPFETFLARRVFEPLGMRDTAFHVPPDKLDRLTAAYQADPVTGELRLDDGISDSKWRTPPAFPDGAAGLVSTVDDYLAFGRMMLNLGRCDGDRILSRPTVQAMITDQLTPAQKAVSGFGPTWFASRGWGLGVSVTTERAGGSAVPGQFGWDGGAGTTWYCDPAEDLIAILFTQRGGFPLMSPVYQDFWTLVYQAIDD
jgi:CubicO group peptidase (beta-lactamase class C family)